MLGAVLIGLATEVSAAFIQADYKYVIAFGACWSCSACARRACSERGNDQGAGRV